MARLIENLKIYDRRTGNEVSDEPMVQKYWEVDLSNPSKFAHTVPDVGESFGLSQYELSKVVAESFHCTNDSEKFKCIECGSNRYVSTRADYARILPNFRCENCIAKEQAEYEEYKSEILSAVVRRCNMKTGKAQRVSYVEAIFLYLWLASEKVEADLITFSPSLSRTITGIPDLDHFFLSSLMKKGLVIERTELLSFTGFENITFINKLDEDYFLIKNFEVNNDASLLNYFFDTVSKFKIDESDVEDMKSVIQFIRVNNLYSLVDVLAKEYSLNIEKDNKFDVMMNYIAKKFGLRKSYSMLCRKARDTAAYLYSKQYPSYIERKLFSNFISNYLQLMEEKGWELKYTKNLPLEVDVSMLELFVSETYFDSCLGCHSLSADEFVAKWLSALNIDSPETV
ncbi:hypothetical protein [Pleionea litopenaei]|uniref:Uncharacterized protein n=1 Tax=Pleionea litopenaei TaxID=3070815 RepID=A0AA51X6D6_9GAMM|nr:hypothetical protein [Pleionea sp. HL-JVS1]WMS86711.1 hypothetical protein Q9312_15935 [Pleionea sp. HL-JVS1]